jgi:RNA polymerase sigma-70 factor (ECF subfamily)
MTDTTDPAQDFERHRPYLRRVALKVLGSENDADDAVQETWVRFDRAGLEGIGDLRAWLTTVTSRVCLDMLRAPRRRREVPLAIDLDELLADPASDAAGRPPTPEEEALLAESVGVALQVVMDSLTPAERVAFVLHDIFELPFALVGEILGRSTDAAKMLATRARRRIRLVPEDAGAHDDEDRAVVDAFFAAAGSGDLTGLLALLAPDAELHALSPAGTSVLHGADRIAAQAHAAQAGAASGAVLRPIAVRGAAGVLVVAGDRPLALMAFTVSDGLITRVSTLTDPERLARLRR